ncbi:uncharacterized protein LOC9304436 [Arabidopsis lyrata subsp. lyrata]|uniref:uncharacterized protein LOC9304436 n=1 Tax=Arabidopsis lyrata subsp. lyrata TaxID=81972 RepID=UPI000A29B0B1|nr:uncharacterized protein LOC9304436 [Arabidopsis lyrata subsp. lyrata]|eukprot:XP_020874102.1 uncharacterized protein LOC9304436 [Arabidopsis lyrata subsp. lyrata]
MWLSLTVKLSSTYLPLQPVSSFCFVPAVTCGTHTVLDHIISNSLIIVCRGSLGGCEGNQGSDKALIIEPSQKQVLGNLFNRQEPSRPHRGNNFSDPLLKIDEAESKGEEIKRKPNTQIRCNVRSAFGLLDQARKETNKTERILQWFTLSIRSMMKVDRHNKLCREKLT